MNNNQRFAPPVASSTSSIGLAQKQLQNMFQKEVLGVRHDNSNLNKTEVLRRLALVCEFPKIDRKPKILIVCSDRPAYQSMHIGTPP